MRALSIPALAVERLRRRWQLQLALGLGLTAAVGLAASFPLVGSAAQEAGFRSYFDGLGAKRFVTVELPSSGDSYDHFEQNGASEVRSVSGGQLIPGARYAASGELQPRTLNGAHLQVSAGDPRPTLGYFEDVAPHVKLMAGSWPQAAGPGARELPATMSQTGADQLALSVGDLYCAATLGLQAQTLCFRITGLWQPLSAADPYWGLGLPPRALTLARDDMLRLPLLTPGAAFRWGAVFYPDPAQAHARNAAALAQAVRTLRGFFAVRRDGQLSTGLDKALDAYAQRAATAQFTVQMVGAQLLLLALFFVAFASGHVLRQQLPAFAVWRARGWAPRHLFLLLLLEFAILAVLATPAGLALAWLATWLVARAFFQVSPQAALADPPALWPPVAGALFGILLVLAAQAARAARLPPTGARRALSRPEARPWWRWRNLDLALAILALPLLAELRLQGSAAVRGAGGVDPVAGLVGLALPAAALAAFGLLALRLLPVGSWLLRPLRRRPAGALAGWQLDRRPGQHAALALLLTFTVAIGLFAGVYASTERRNATDRVAYAAGADLRVQFAQTYQPAELDDVISDVHGLQAATQVLRTEAQPGNSTLQATLLAVQPGSFRQVAWSREDLDGRPLPALLQELSRKDGSGLAIPGLPGNLSLWADSAGLDATLTADLVDANGAPLRVTLGKLQQSGWRQLQGAVPAGAVAPLRLLDLEFASTGGSATDGVVALSDLAADGRTLEDFQRSDGWWRWPVPTFQDPALTGSLLTPRGAQASTRVEVHVGTGRAWVRPAPAGGPVPALLSAGTLQRLGIGLFQPFDLRLDGRKVPVVGVAEIDYFPTLYPQLEDFLVAAREPLLDRLARDGDPAAWPNEAWLKVDALDAGVAAGKLEQRGDIVTLSDRAAMAALAAREPLRLDLAANLTLGFVAALALAVLGFGFHFFVAARGRLAEYAVLRANGLSGATIADSLVYEQAVLLGFSVLVGAGLGALLSVTVLPTLELAADVHDVVPPTVVTVDPLLTAAALLAVVGGSLLAGRVAGWLGARARLLDELRMLAV